MALPKREGGVGWGRVGPRVLSGCRELAACDETSRSRPPSLDGSDVVTVQTFSENWQGAITLFPM